MLENLQRYEVRRLPHFLPSTFQFRRNSRLPEKFGSNGAGCFFTIARSNGCPAPYATDQILLDESELPLCEHLNEISLYEL
jgi:hypothetical protein